jgi:hypothetical protein
MQLVEELLGRVLEHGHLREAGVVHQVVERRPVPSPAQLGGDPIDEGWKTLAPSQVERKRDGRASELLDRGDGIPGAVRVRVVRENDASAALGDPDGSALADSRAGAGDDGDFIALSRAVGQRKAVPAIRTMNNTASGLHARAS